MSTREIDTRDIPLTPTSSTRTKKGYALLENLPSLSISPSSTTTTTTPEEFNFEQTIEHIGNGAFQYKLLLLCGLGWISDAFEMVMLSLIQPDLQEQFGLTSIETGLLASFANAGMLVGAAFWSFMSDTVGRKPAFVLTVTCSSVFGVASSLSPNYWSLIMLRFLVGFGLGGNFPITYSMFIEFLASSNRARLAVLLSAFWPIGFMLSSALTYVVMPRLGWRWLFSMSALPGFLLLVFLRSIPESPRYLALRGKKDAAWDVLRLVARSNRKAFPSNVQLSSVPCDTLSEPYHRLVLAMFSRHVIRTTASMWAIWFLASMGYFGVAAWLPTYMEKLGVSTDHLYQSYIVVGIGQLVGLILASLVVEKVGRKLMLVALFLGTSICAIMFNFSRGDFLIALFAVLVNTFNNSASGILYTITSEAFPTKIRSSSVGLCSVFNKSAGIIAPLLGGALYSAPIVISFGVWSCSYLLAAMVTASLRSMNKQSLDHSTTAAV